MSEEWSYAIGDLVWAKMKGFPPWPGRVVDPPDALKRFIKKNSKCILFFGSGKYVWIELRKLKPYFLFRDSLTYCCNSIAFEEACEDIEEFIKDNM